MPDTIAHSADDVGSTALAETLARNLDLDLAAFARGERPDAALEVAPTRERRHRNPAAPVVVVPRRAAMRSLAGGRPVVCGARDEADAPAVATAAAIADALERRLVLVHVVPRSSPLASGAVPGAVIAPVLDGVTVEDAAVTLRMFDDLVAAAGLDATSPPDRRVLRGPPAPTLMAHARSENAALIVVSASTRRGPLRILAPPVTGHLARRCDRPVLVCPRHPAAAMRVREALSSAPQRA